MSTDGDRLEDDADDVPLRGFGQRLAAAPVRRLRSLSFNRIFPNILTLLALCAGLTAIRYGIAGRFEQSVYALVIAAFLDGIDGRIARLLRATSKFGQELDSLADGISFGVCPAIILYLWTMNTASSVGWALCLLYVVCGVLRLARFNTMAGATDVPPWAHNYFTGVPIPSGAGIAIMPLVLWHATGSDFFRSPFVVGFMLLLAAGLMVSRIPTFAGKNMRLKPNWVLPLMLAIGLTATLLVTDFWPTLSVIGFVYMASIPVAMMSFRKRKRGASAPEAPKP